jgi:YVTN family beta-propeller protein
MANNQTITVGIDRNWNINFGNLCDGDTVELRICNYDGGTHTGSLRICGCEAFTFTPTTFTLVPCQCTTITGTFNGNGYPGTGNCFIEVDFNNRKSFVNLNWNEVYCDIEELDWIFGDLNSSIILQRRTFNAECDTTDNYAFAQAVYLQRDLQVAQPLVAGDELFLSQWLFAQIVDWAYQNYPVAGWKTRICLQPAGEGEDPSVDGTYQMEWYGQQPSEENSQDTPYVFAIVSSGGTNIQYRVEFNLPEDSLNAPSNFPLANHRILLANSTRNEVELNNQSENSIYRNLKYMSWAFVVYRSIGSVYQDDIFSIRGKFPFEKEGVGANAVAFFLLSTSLTTPTGQPTQYLSTIRQTKVRVDFQFADNNVTGTPPTDMWVYLIRNDSQNNQLDYYENYEYDQADLTNLVAGNFITPVTPPTNITANEFFAEFDVLNLRQDLTGVENISNNYRFIFITTSALDRQSRSWITEPIQLINYDDQDLTLTGVEAKFRTVEQEYAGTVGTLLGTCVNMNLETVLQANLPLSDAEVQAKTGGLITTAFEAYRGATLSIYEQSPLTGSTLLNTQYFGAKGQLICDKVTDNGLDPIVNNSQGANIDLVFPFTIPDNVYRKIGREGLFQSDINNSNSWSTLSLASLSCVQNRTSDQCDVLFALPDIAGADNPEYMAYIPDTNEVWVCNLASHTISIIDVATLTITATITLTAGDAPVGIVYVPQKGCYVTLQGANSTILIDIYTRSITTTIATPTAPRQIIYASSIDKLFVFCSSADLYEIDPQTNTITNSVNTGQTGGQSVTYYAGNDSLYTVANSSSDFVETPRNTFVPSAPVSVPAQPFSVFASANNLFIGTTNTIEVYDYTNTLITSLPYTGLGGRSIIENAGIIYVGDTANNLVRLIDNTTFSEIATYPAVANPRRLLFGGGHLWLSQFTSDSVRPFLLDCNDSLPPFTMVNRNINLNWDLEFEFFDNTEIYTITQELNRPSPSKVADFINDFVDIIIEEEPNDGTPTPIPIDNLCPTTGQVIVTGNFFSPQRVMSVGIELQPIRGGMVSSESSASPISIPSDSPYIYDLTPAYGTTSSVSFKIDTPSLNLTGDYEIVLHFITQ